ncbi:methyltransferase domain-containing protein [Flavobacterium sp. F-328]|jgi:SAM-dependent methyltransferase|uniref:Methyltransferase domain-containing protein n=1 Tax=Flavobacterium erciyesense TaxID=2825842 RepID=A0ABS5D6J2_9FLAO|nr:methyltransferase domain-containing protein [Flavobacterium erciyesense]MBQ0909655.1 methyltransferase domain-containing protein [Flavobacterium erciyesense]
MSESKEINLNQTLNKNYWDNRYQTNNTQWDIGQVAPPIQEFIDTIADKNARILIPGCGNCYEAIYLLQQGFTAITLIDIAPTLVNSLQVKFKDNPQIQVILGDFFEHQDSYDYILEQTFFCALPPQNRPLYVSKMKELLAPKGVLFGLLFDRDFESGPPFGGNKLEYHGLFESDFNIISLEKAKNSIQPRANAEVFIHFLRKN